MDVWDLLQHNSNKTGQELTEAGSTRTRTVYQGPHACSVVQTVFATQSPHRDAQCSHWPSMLMSHLATQEMRISYFIVFHCLKIQNCSELCKDKSQARSGPQVLVCQLSSLWHFPFKILHDFYSIFILITILMAKIVPALCKKFKKNKNLKII